MNKDEIKIDLVGGTTIPPTQGITSVEGFTSEEFADMADFLESHLEPSDNGSHLRRLANMLWALQNDTTVFVLYNEEMD